MVACAPSDCPILFDDEQAELIRGDVINEAFRIVAGEFHVPVGSRPRHDDRVFGTRIADRRPMYRGPAVPGQFSDSLDGQVHVDTKPAVRHPCVTMTPRGRARSSPPVRVEQRPRTWSMSSTR